MPEFRDNKRVLHAAGEDGGGESFIKRVASPSSLVVRGTGRKHLARRYILPSSNKENMPPVLAVKVTPPKRSPLPKWYSRVPLCDITAIAKAIQRSRLRIAATQEQSRRSEQSLQSVNLTTPAQAEQDILLEASFADASSSESSMKPPTKPTDPSMADTVEKKLSTSIEQIEKMAKKNMQRTPKAAQRAKRAIQRRTLMSLR